MKSEVVNHARILYIVMDQPKQPRQTIVKALADAGLVVLKSAYNADKRRASVALVIPGTGNDLDRTMLAKSLKVLHANGCEKVWVR